jgi:hypothetical protein
MGLRAARISFLRAFTPNRRVFAKNGLTHVAIDVGGTKP